MKLRSYKMPDELIARLEAESDRTGAPKSEIIRRAIVAYLSKSDKPRRSKNASEGRHREAEA